MLLHKTMFKYQKTLQMKYKS